jgi:hypothetical protein
MNVSMTSLVPARARFPLGRVVVTEKACRLDPAVLAENLHRHARGDFGPVHGFHTDNARALHQGRDMTAASLEPRAARFFRVVTTAQPRRTVLMLPEEYGHAHVATINVSQSEDRSHAPGSHHAERADS